MPEVVRVHRRRRGTRCAYCHGEVVAEDARTECPGCEALHHAECWVERCASCAASSRAARDADAPIASSEEHATYVRAVVARDAAAARVRAAERGVAYGLGAGFVLVASAAAFLTIVSALSQGDPSGAVALITWLVLSVGWVVGPVGLLVGTFSLVMLPFLRLAESYRERRVAALEHRR